MGMTMLKTTSKHVTIPHRLFWHIVQEHAQMARERYPTLGWSHSAVVAMTFASHAIEAYLNCVGELLAQAIWQDERNYFRHEPYRGRDGKLRKVLELVGLSWPLVVERPFATILELNALRDAIAHAKPETVESERLHTDDLPPAGFISQLRAMYTPIDKLERAVQDVEEFLNQIHRLAAPKVNDPWFGPEALQGSTEYREHKTTAHE
jgi:hypothetical protein